MAKTALRFVAGYSAIEAAWKDIYKRSRPKSRNTVGVDEVSINHFARDPKPLLRFISSEVHSEEYAFSALRPHFVLKPNGKRRLICVPTVNDRIVQRATLDFLTAKYGTRFANPISFGFIKGRTVQDAAERACRLREKHGWAFKTDISTFFDSVDRRLLHARITHAIRHRSLHRLLIAASNCEIDPPGKGAQKKHLAVLGIKVGVGIRQGMPLSPFFANLFLEPFDGEILRAGFNAVRYADDLVFFADSKEQCETIEAFCKESLHSLNLTIPDTGPNSKSEIVPPDEAIEFLGLGLRKNGVQYELVLLKAQRDAIRTELMQLGSISNLLSRNIRLANLGHAIESRISGYLNTYECCTNYVELENALGGLHQCILRRLYGKDGLGLDIGSLSSEQLSFLGLFS